MYQLIPVIDGIVYRKETELFSISQKVTKKTFRLYVGLT